MALLGMDSCGDHYPTADIEAKWTRMSGLTGVTVVTGRTGNGAVRAHLAAARHYWRIGRHQEHPAISAASPSGLSKVCTI